MRSVVVVVLLAVVPASADTPPQPGPQPESKAAPAPTPAPAPQAGLAPAPAPKGQPRTLPPAALQDVMPTAPKPPDVATGGPAFGGGTAAGIVIKPDPHPDDQPWPKGMIITPPDVNDAIAIAPGTDMLAPGKPRAPATWSKIFADAVHEGLGTIIDLMLPKPM